METSQDKRSTFAINLLSITIPLVVAVLLGVRTKVDLGKWTSILPHAIGAINTLTSVLLVLGMIVLKAGKIQWHRYAMTAAFVLGGLFLVCYVTYHLSNPSTEYGGTGLWRGIYYFILISHILLSMVVLPLVLRAFYFAITDQFARHMRVAKFAFPIWLYVSVTGVLVYLMISPFYRH
jgi:putative membrane protein